MKLMDEVKLESSVEALESILAAYAGRLPNWPAVKQNLQALREVLAGELSSPGRNVDLVAWLREREDTCQRLAAESGDGAPGWLEDADYFRRAVGAITDAALWDAYAEGRKDECETRSALQSGDLPPLPQGYQMMMTPDPEGTPAVWYDEQDMREYARAAIAITNEKAI